MPYRFRQHYTREQARALLPQLRCWLRKLQDIREALDQQERRSGQLLAAGTDLGGESVNRWIRNLCELRQTLLEFERREIQVKDITRGLVDFPALLGDREVFLCWEQDEADIEFWHDLDTGFAGRERL